MNEVPSLKEIHVAFEERCDAECDECRFGEDSDCRMQFAYAVLTGKMKLTDSFRTDEPKHEPETPAWCKEGQWVIDAYPDTNLRFGVFKITEIWDGYATIERGERKCNCLVSGLKPVRFREYTFEEARKLLGKVMEYAVLDENDVDIGRRAHELVTSVCSGDGDGPLINCYSFRNFVKSNATIDGIPIGVPEIDEEALKKE